MTDQHDFMSHDLSTEHMDSLAYRRINKKWMDFERGLFKSKWFDYRFLHPVESTMLYMESFGAIYRRFYAQTMDSKAAEHISVPRGNDFLEDSDKNNSRILGCWRGRQIADALGMPYDIYINLAMEKRLRYWQKKRLPRPHQLYSEIIVEKMPELWKERQMIKLHYSALHNYRNESYNDYNWQNDHHEWLFHQANMRGDQALFLAGFIKGKLLPVEKVKSRVGVEVFEKILAHQTLQ